MLYYVRDCADAKGRPDLSGDILPGNLSAGGSAVGIAPDATLLPRELIEAADATISIAPLRGRDIAKIIRAITRCKRCPRIDDALVAALTPSQLALAIRATTTPAACLQRLRAIAARANATDVVDGLRLEDLAGYGQAMTWAMALKSDIEARRSDPSISLDTITRSILLAGPPGTGKTTFASALAKSCGIPLFMTGFADLQSGDAHLEIVLARLRDIFADAKAAAARAGGAILAFGEIDSLPSRDSGGGRRLEPYFASITNALLALISDDARSRSMRGVIFFGITNFPDRVDPALRRSGRMMTITIKPPDTATLGAILRTILAGDLPDADLMSIARWRPGATGADAAKWVRDARRAARQAGRPLAYDDLVAQVLPAETRPRSIVLATARHEAAHAVVGDALGEQRLESVTLCAPGAEGATQFAVIADRRMDKAHLEALVVTGLAGRAADKAFDGADAQSGGGPGSDLGNATKLLAALHSSFGLGGRLLSIDPDEALARIHFDPALAAKVETDLQRLYARAKDLVAAHRTEIEMVAAVLVRKRFLSGDDVRALLKRVRAADATRMAPNGRTTS